MRNKLLKYAISLILLVLTYTFIPTGRIAELLVDVSLADLALPLTVLILAGLITSYRFYVLTQQFELGLPFRSAHFINIMSQVSGLVMFQTLGQVISRAGIGSLYTRNPQRMVLLTFIEKGASFFSLFFIAIIGVYSAIKTIHVDLLSISPLLFIFGTLLIGVLVIWKYGLTASERRYLKKSFSLIIKVRFGHITLTCVGVHLLTLSGYVIVAHSFLPASSVWLLAAAFGVVMLGASFPISFAGWGVRELTAGFVFSTLSLDPAIGVIVAALIGILSLVAIAAHGLVCTMLLKNEKAPTVPKLVVGHDKLHMERLTAFISAGAIALLIGSQMPISALTSKTTVNLADPFALVGGLTFIAFWYLWHKKSAIWRVPHMNLGLALFIAMILLGWVVGYLKYGSGSWASVNRGFGLIIVFCYLASGAMFTAFFGRKSIVTILRVMFLITVPAYVIYWTVITFHLIPYETMQGMGWFSNQFNGLANNRNAFALQMSLVLALMIAIPKPSRGGGWAFPIAIVTFFILASGSRTGMLSSITIFGLAMYMRLLDTASFTRILGYFVAFLFLDFAGHFFLDPGQYLLSFITGEEYLIGHLRTQDMLFLQTDRMASYIGGFNMWKEHWLIGGGLGAFIDSQGSIPLIIHNTVLWILAEMGIVGLTLWLVLPLSLVSHALRNGVRNASWEDSALLLCLVSAFIFSLVHEIYFQRIIWFFIGLLTSNHWGIATQNKFKN